MRDPSPRTAARRRLAAALSLCALLGLAGCAMPPGQVAVPTATPVAAPTAAPAPAPTAAPVPGPTAPPTATPAPSPSAPPTARPTDAPAPSPSAPSRPTPFLIYTPPEPSPEPTPDPYDFSQPVPLSDEVDMSWFSDAVFVGDSLTDGLRLYGGIKEAQFFYYKGLSTLDFSTERYFPSGERMLTALEALESRSYGKVYILLGLNDLGYSVSKFSNAYSQVIDAVRQAQPGAVVYFQTLTPANPQKAKEKGLASYITNEKIAQFNEEIARLCQEKQVLYLNVAEGMVDETGILPYEHTTDGVHFTKDWYQRWVAYLRTHTVDPQQLEVSAHEDPSSDPAAESVPAAEPSPGA